MNEKYKNLQWVVQSNLTSSGDFENLKKACSEIGVHFIGLNVIPFTEQLPTFDKSKYSIIYGSTTFNSLALKDKKLQKGVFFNEESFSIENYISKWGKHMLNYNASIIPFQELITSKQFGPEQLLFIRPNDDSKSFAGEVKKFAEIEMWYNNLKMVDNANISFNTKIIVSEPYNIQYEWRLWIVNRKVIAASKYREYFKLKKEEGCPKEVVEFAEERCKEYVPHEIFVMDICLCGTQYYIVECGGINGAGFYKANIKKIVEEVTNHFALSLEC